MTIYLSIYPSIYLSIIKGDKVEEERLETFYPKTLIQCKTKHIISNVKKCHDDKLKTHVIALLICF